MDSQKLNGKVLRRFHRTAMLREGGLVQEKQKGLNGEEVLRTVRTEKYVSFRTWLATQGNKKIQAATEEWHGHKRAQRRARRINGPNNPHSPSKMRRIREWMKKRMEEIEAKEAEEAARKKQQKQKKAKAS